MKLNTLCRNALVGTALVFAASSALAGISTTKHNLGTNGTGSNKTTGNTDEICVFCHTPHAADSTAPAPLWNKRINTGATYTTYASLNSTTIDGEIIAVGSVSLACLSCHDGTQAMDNIINAPGSGGLTADGGGADGLNYSWGSSPRIDAGGVGRLTGIANLQPDLRNDHPIGVQYGGGGVSGTTLTTNDPDFVAPTRATIAGRSVWWVDTSAAGTREKADMILYTRSDFTGGVDQPSVECATCHDPHSTNTTFLRIQNTGSAVCLACHDK